MRRATAEMRLRELFERDGLTVIRSAGSRGPVDLVVLSAAFVFLIQVKTGSAEVTGAERGALERLPRPVNSFVEIWARIRGGWTVETFVGGKWVPETLRDGGKWRAANVSSSDLGLFP